MNYALMLVCLSLALFLAVNLAGAGIAMIAIRLGHRRLARYPAARRARALLILGTAPTVCAFGAVLFVLLPSFLAFEPESTVEIPGISLAILALFSLIGIVWAISRWWLRSVATRRLINEWMREAEAVDFDGVNQVCYRIEHPFPVVAIIGVFKPRLFIANQVTALLTERELAAALTHERGHLSARHNLRRWMLAICRDLLPFIPGLSQLEKEWSATAETVADQYALQSGQGLDLASALVKIARKVPTGVGPIAPAGSLLVDEDTTRLASRVESLVEGAAKKGNETQPTELQSVHIPVWLAAAGVAAILFATQPDLLARVHAVVEHAVEILK